MIKKFFDILKLVFDIFKIIDFGIYSCMVINVVRLNFVNVIFFVFIYVSYFEISN